MQKYPEKLQNRIDARKSENTFRQLSSSTKLVDFYSNDYLGFARSSEIYSASLQILKDHQLQQNGATGSRLLSGNHSLFQITEDFISNFHQAETALIYNSGFDANTGFFSSVPLKGDLIFYDELCHASIREGIQLSNATGFKFHHNNLIDLQDKIVRQHQKFPQGEVYVVSESVFSMDGDTAPLPELASLCEELNAFLIIDEAHALGVFGEKGKGLVQHHNLQDRVFARIMTFGKGLGCNGAAILGSQNLRDYLINFSRSFIYTTAASPHMVASILSAYKQMDKQNKENSEIESLIKNINFFKSEIVNKGLETQFIESNSAIQCLLISGVFKVKQMAGRLQNSGFEVKAILSPTVPEGKERLRFCLHSYNSSEEISRLFSILKSAHEQ